MSRALKNGICCFGPSIFVSAAFCLSLASSSVCDFLDLDQDNIRKVGIFKIDKIGFWCYEQVGSGNRYSISDVELDSAFEAARALGLVANILGAFAWCTYLVAGCIPCSPKVFLFTGLICFLTFFFECFKFWMFRSTYVCDGTDLGCSMGTGGRCSISAAVFWFLASLMTCGHAKERMGHEDNGRRGDGGGDDRREHDEEEK